MNPLTWRSHRIRNVLHAASLLSSMALLLGLLGWSLAGKLGLLFAVAAVVTVGLYSSALSSRPKLQIAGARQLSVPAAPELHEYLRELSAQAQLQTTPSLYYIPSTRIRAFAFGDSDRSSLAVSDGILQALSQRELMGVLAHEISHIRNGDTRLLTLMALFARMTRTLSNAGLLLLLLSIPFVLLDVGTLSVPTTLLLIFAPALSELMQLALARTREFDADLGAVALTHDPSGLAGALEKLSRMEHGWMQRMLHFKGARTPAFLRTHPATRERIKRLHGLTTEQPMATRGWTSRGDRAPRVSPAGIPDLALYRHHRGPPASASAEVNLARHDH